MNEGVVEGGEKVSYSKDFFAFNGFWSKIFTVFWKGSKSGRNSGEIIEFNMIEYTVVGVNLVDRGTYQIQ